MQPIRILYKTSKQLSACQVCLVSYLDNLNENKKVQVGKDQEKAQSEKDSHSKNRGGKKPNQQSGTYTMKTYRKQNEQLFSQYVATQLPKLN